MIVMPGDILTEEEALHELDIVQIFSYLTGETEVCPDTEVIRRVVRQCYMSACQLNEDLSEGGSRDDFSDKVIACYGTSESADGYDESQLDVVCGGILILLAENGYPRYGIVVENEGLGRRFGRVFKIMSILEARRSMEQTMRMTRRPKT
jgi:hypothetical protein